MKKALLLTVGSFMLFILKISAQCNFISPTVELNFISTPVAGYCDINFNISFEINQNGGNKYTFVHLWRTADYQNWIGNANYNAYSSTQNTQPEYNNNGGDNLNILQNALATVIINNENVPLTLESTYGPDPDAPVKNTTTNPGITVVRQTSGANYRYTISNVVVRIPTPAGPNGCSSSLSFTGDAWSSQSNGSNPPIHCSMLNWSFTVNDVNVSGTKTCNNPLKYSLLASTSQTTPFNIYYNVYVDNGDGVFNTSTDFLVVNNSGPHTISAGSPYSVSNQSFDDPNSPYALPAYKDRSLWYLITAPTVFSNLVLYEANNACAILAVGLTQFDAQRNGGSVSLQWTTTQEQNNKGFTVERNTGAGWQDIAFVASQAPGGNSSTSLVYRYSDINSTKGVTQYRLRQSDMDGKIKYSETRLVRGDADAARTLIYPNPSKDGKVTVVFPDMSAGRNAALTDMSGRIIRQWSNIPGNSLGITGLQPGMYTLKILNTGNGTQSAEKILVLKD